MTIDGSGMEAAFAQEESLVKSAPGTTDRLFVGATSVPKCVLPQTCGCHAAVSASLPAMPDRSVAPTDWAPTRTLGGFCRCKISPPRIPTPSEATRRVVHRDASDQPARSRPARRRWHAVFGPGLNRCVNVAHLLVRIRTRRCPFSTIPIEDAKNGRRSTGVGSSGLVITNQMNKWVDSVQKR